MDVERDVEGQVFGALRDLGQRDEALSADEERDMVEVGDAGLESEGGVATDRRRGGGVDRVGGVDEGTFRTWVWWFIEELSFLEPEVVCAAISYTSTTCSSHFSHKEYLLLFVVVLYRFDGRTGSRMTWEMIVLSQ